MKDGTAVPMSGVLPAAACSRATRRTAAAAEITLGRTTWLSPVGATLRGYLNPSWQIEISDPACSLARETELQGALLGRNQVIGSLLHLNFAAQPHFLRCFFQPQRVLGRLPRQTG